MRTVDLENIALADMDVAAYGSPDDHLRMTVLLSEFARRRNGTALDQDAVEACQSPTSPWCDRLEALRELLANVPDLRIFDIDALPYRDPNPVHSWSDAEFQVERFEFFELLVELAERLGWQLTRPLPDPKVSRALEERGIEVERQGHAGAGEVFERVPPALRRLARCLVEQFEEWTAESLAETIEIAEEEDLPLDRSLISSADLRLSLEAREAAMRLALCRPTLSLNGSVGPFPGDDGDALHRIPERALRELEALGLISISQRRLAMTRPIRNYFESTAWVAPELDFEAEHQFLARETPSREPESLIERHYHAIQARDADVAFETATFYVSDLRLLAIDASKRGNYSRAAAIFEKLVKIDCSDAYAWEYWAFNLARHAGSRKSRSEDIRKAYRKAHELEPSNPLYHGRWLGYRAQIGEAILDELTEALSTWQGTSGETWLAKPALDGIYRSNDHDLIEAAEERFGRDRIEDWRRRSEA